MTHYLADRKFSLAQAPFNIRVLLTLFSALMTLALVVGVVNYWDKTGLTPAGIVAHYQGNEGQPLAAGSEMTFQKSFRELLDATHPHLFGQGILLFILCHIVALTGLSDRTKVTLYGVSFGALLLDAAMPWLIRYVTPGMAPLQLLSTVALFGSFFTLLGVTLRDTWFTARVKAAPVAPRESIWPGAPVSGAEGGAEVRPRQGRPGRDGREKRRPRREGTPGRGGRGPGRAHDTGAARTVDAPAGGDD